MELTGVLTYEQRLATARAAVDYLTGHSVEDMKVDVPNCPGWTVYNAAVHVGRVSVAWEGMMRRSPDDEDARDKAYAESALKPTGASPAQLAAWAHSAIDYISGDDSRECFFSMADGRRGTTGLWAWHAASEIGVHRLDVESALAHPHALSDDEAVDSIAYACRFFLPAMRRVTETDPGAVSANVTDADGAVLSTIAIPEGPSTSEASVTLTGPAVQVLLALWGRPYEKLDVTGDAKVLDGWRQLPATSFQFGTWE